MSAISRDLFQNLIIRDVTQARHMPKLEIVMLRKSIIKARSAYWLEADITSPTGAHIYYVVAYQA